MAATPQQNGKVEILPTTTSKFEKGGPLWRHHRPQWHVYMAEL